MKIIKGEFGPRFDAVKSTSWGHEESSVAEPIIAGQSMFTMFAQFQFYIEQCSYKI